MNDTDKLEILQKAVDKLHRKYAILENYRIEDRLKITRLDTALDRIERKIKENQ